MSDKPRIYLSPPHVCGRELDFVHEAFRTNWIAPAGPDPEAFEQEVSPDPRPPGREPRAGNPDAIDAALPDFTIP